MPDYSNTIIYHLYSTVEDLHYYGATTQTIAQRLSKHRSDAKRPTCSNSSRHVINTGSYQMDWLEDWPCCCKHEQGARERMWIQSNPCVNKNIPNRTSLEYYLDNKDVILKTKKEWYIDHKADMAEHYKTNRAKLLAKQNVYNALPHNKARAATLQAIRTEWTKSCDGLNRINIL